jgi:3-oxoacyl-[acyl-carrier-protein] synthase-3
MVETSDEWIVTRTGIKERRIADGSTATSDLAVEAARRALEMSGVDNESIDLLIVATVTPDYKLPSTACIVQQKIGLPHAAAFDVVAACAGFINAMSIATSYIRAGMYHNIMIIGVEKLSSFTNYEDRNTCVLFGDGAGAAVLGPAQNGSGVLSTFVRSDGNLSHLLWSEVGGCAVPFNHDNLTAGRDKILMNGSDVFKIAVREMGRASEFAIKEAGLTADDIALVLPHQANIRIIEARAKRLKIPMEKVYLNIDKYGNTSAASVPLALDEANREGRIKPGDNLLMVAFGGGLIWGAAVVRW